MEQKTKMMCPFRRKENGDFEPCYGKGCMAYCEWKSYQFRDYGSNSNGEQVVNVTCKLLFQNGGINGCNPVI